MGFNLDQILKVKDTIEKNTIPSIIQYAQMAYPNECCGFILENGSIQPAHNVVHTLYNSSLTTRNAFLIDARSWQIVSTRESPVVCIYHSHTNGDPNMSSADETFLQWENYCYLILALVDSNPVASKLFWWEDKVLKNTNINIG